MLDFQTGLWYDFFTEGGEAVTDQELLNAISGIVSQHLEAGLGRLETRLDRLEEKVDHLETRMDGLEARMDRLEEKVDRLEARMDRLEEKVDQNYDKMMEFYVYQQETNTQLLERIAYFVELLRIFSDQTIKNTMELRQRYR